MAAAFPCDRGRLYVCPLCKKSTVEPEPAKAKEWISVDEQLPDPHELVLVLRPPRDDGRPWYDLAARGSLGGWGNGATERLEVTHWRHLPRFPHDPEEPELTEKWIPVDGRLPSDGSPKLVYGHRECTGPEMRVEGFDKEWGWSGPLEVTHWQDAPTPPAEPAPERTAPPFRPCLDCDGTGWRYIRPVGILDKCRECGGTGRGR